MNQSIKHMYLILTRGFLCLKIYNQIFLLHLIVLLFLLDFTASNCQQFTLAEKWDILLKCLDPNFNSTEQFQCLEYLDYFRQQVYVDLCLLDSKQQIQQYYKFIQHMSELTQDCYDPYNRDYKARKLYIESLHLRQWNYWYQIKLLRQ